MIIRSLFVPLVGAALLFGSTAMAAAAKTPTAFTATYRVTQGGMPHQQAYAQNVSEWAPSGPTAPPPPNP